MEPCKESSNHDLTLFFPVCLSTNSTADQDLSTTSNAGVTQLHQTVALDHFLKLLIVDSNLVSIVWVTSFFSTANCLTKSNDLQQETRNTIIFIASFSHLQSLFLRTIKE